MKSGSEEWKGRLVGADKELGGDLWTLNPTHLWTQWPQRLSQRKLWRNRRRETDTPFRAQEQIRSSTLRWKTGLWEPDDKRRYKASPCEEALCVAESSRHTVPALKPWGGGRRVNQGRGYSIKRIQKERKRAPKPQCAFIYQRTTPHEGKTAIRQSGFALLGWHANPRGAHACTLHTHGEGHEGAALCWRPYSNMIGDYPV